MMGFNGAKLSCFEHREHFAINPIYLEKKMAITPTTSIPLGFAAPAFQLPDAISGETLDSNALFEGGSHGGCLHVQPLPIRDTSAQGIRRSCG